MLKNIWNITKKDLRSYFNSPIAYIVIALFLLIMGWMFINILNHFVFSQYGQYAQFGMNRSISLTDGVIKPFFGNMNVVLLLLVPFLTMRLLAEERKQHTIELLLTAPIGLTDIILGKFLASFLLLFIMLGITFIYPAILMIYGNPEIGPILTSYLGTLLLTSCYLGFGLMFSAMTENQIIAGALCFSMSLFFWLINWASESSNKIIADILHYLSLIGHFNNFSQGLIVTSDLVFYISFIGMGLFLTHRILDSFRWR
jgi:ABC-2 type transport system permease protein